MAKYTQANRPLAINTPLGKDALLLVGVQGEEAISQLFHFQLDLLAEHGTPIDFHKILGQPATVMLGLPSKGKRYISGIVNRFTQGRRDESFTYFQAELVPPLWLLTKKMHSRIFQRLSVPDILKQVFAGLNVSFQFKTALPARDYCVQYRESDFAFASRLMEEEGISYYFQHAAGGVQMIVTGDPFNHPDVPVQPQAIYEQVAGGTRPDLRFWEWNKTQELRAGKYAVWDYHFALPDKHLEAEQAASPTLPVGKVSHKLLLGSNEGLVLEDYPGGYAHRFDEVDKGGTAQPAELPKIFQDNKRLARVRLEQEQVPGLAIQGASNCGQFTAGHQFTLVRHFDGNGPYYLAHVEHSARLGHNYRSGDGGSYTYENRFTCHPAALPYRPASVTPKPSLPSMQTAVVVGPPGEVIFCDKYGRVKVQFHWDRQGKKNADSSCWLRVGQMAADKGFGAVCLPRIGQEVIVAFLEGDPDEPLIVGSVYNDANMPPYKLPDLRTFSGIVHRSHNGVLDNANEIRFENQLGQERMLVHSETDLHVQAENHHIVNTGKFAKEVVGRKVVWDKGKGLLGKIAAAVGSGAGGGGQMVPARVEETGNIADTRLDLEHGTGLPPETPKPANEAIGSGGGGATLDEKADDAGKLSMVYGGADVTIDNKAKSTYVNFGNRTVVWGGSWTRAQKDLGEDRNSEDLANESKWGTVDETKNNAPLTKDKAGNLVDAQGNPVGTTTYTDKTTGLAVIPDPNHSGQYLDGNGKPVDPKNVGVKFTPDPSAKLPPDFQDIFDANGNYIEKNGKGAINVLPRGNTTEVYGGSQTTVYTKGNVSRYGNITSPGLDKGDDLTNGKGNTTLVWDGSQTIVYNGGNLTEIHDGNYTRLFAGVDPNVPALAVLPGDDGNRTIGAASITHDYGNVATYVHKVQTGTTIQMEPIYGPDPNWPYDQPPSPPGTQPPGGYGGYPAGPPPQIIIGYTPVTVPVFANGDVTTSIDGDSTTSISGKQTTNVDSGRTTHIKGLNYSTLTGADINLTLAAMLAMRAAIALTGTIGAHIDWNLSPKIQTLSLELKVAQNGLQLLTPIGHVKMGMISLFGGLLEIGMPPT